MIRRVQDRVAISTLLGRKVGIPRTDYQAPIWAGRAVNYAARATQQANAYQTVITAPTFNAVMKNDYLALSCGCPKETVSKLWTPMTIDHVGSNDSVGQYFDNSWCDEYGDATHAYAAKLLVETREELTRADSKAATLFAAVGVVIGAAVGSGTDIVNLATKWQVGGENRRSRIQALPLFV